MRWHFWIHVTSKLPQWISKWSSWKRWICLYVYIISHVEYKITFGIRETIPLDLPFMIQTLQWANKSRSSALWIRKLALIEIKVQAILQSSENARVPSKLSQIRDFAVRKRTNHNHNERAEECIVENKALILGYYFAPLMLTVVQVIPEWNSCMNNYI